MKDKLKKFMNIYVISSLIGAFSMMYLISFAVIQSDIANGSSLKMHRAQMAQEQKAKP